MDGPFVVKEMIEIHLTITLKLKQNEPHVKLPSTRKRKL